MNKEIEKLITDSIPKIRLDYGMEQNAIAEQYISKRLITHLTKVTWLSGTNITVTLKHLLSNYPKYRTINVAVFMSAFYESVISKRQ